MTKLISLWIDKKEFFEDKKVEQIVSMAGDGLLKDGSAASAQLREYFSNIPSKNIAKYVEECLLGSFDQSGFVLQDLVNEIGKRLGFSVESGCYRGGAGKIGFDGIWRADDGYGFVVEVKTTDAYQLNLDTQANYRNRLIADNRIGKEKSSILLVVGRKDTGGLEAQTRGSRHAWDIRLISIDALLKLLQIKENLNDSATVLQIHRILKPIEYTRVDQLVQIIFKTSEDVMEDPSDADTKDESGEKVRATPAKYHDACIERVSRYLKTPLIKQGKCSYASADNSVRVICSISKEYRVSGIPRYWYAFHPSQKDFLNASSKSFVALGCGSADQVVLIPFVEFMQTLPLMRKTENGQKYYWHVEVFKRDAQFMLFKTGKDGIDVSRHLVRGLNAE